MAELFANGTIVQWILAFMLIEAGVLLLLRRTWRSRQILAELLASLVAGAALLMALSAALRGASWHSVALWLLLALIAHASDVLSRLARDHRPNTETSSV